MNSNILGTGDLSLSGTNDISGSSNTISQNSITNTGDLTANVGQITLTDGMTNNSSRPGVMLYYFSFFCCSSLYFSSMIRSSKLDNTDVSCARSVMWIK